ncbi:MAG: hypothetical protein QM756_18835 [Polyangiaceae bacterium]
MSVQVDDILKKMLDAGAAAFGQGWSHVKAFAPVEFKKIALQLAEIAENVAKFELDPNDGFSPETGKLLVKMQRNATESVLVAVSALTLIAVQKALDGIFAVLKAAFSSTLGLLL